MFHVKNIRLIRGLDWVNGQHVCFLWLVDIVRREPGLVGSGSDSCGIACQNRLNLLPFGSLSLAVAVFGEALLISR